MGLETLLWSAGTRIIYDRKFLLQCRSSPLTRTPPNLPDIPGVTRPMKRTSSCDSPQPHETPTSSSEHSVHTEEHSGKNASLKYDQMMSFKCFKSFFFLFQMMLSLKLISEKMTDMEVIPKMALLFTVRETRKVNNLDFKAGFYSSVIYCQEALIMLE